MQPNKDIVRLIIMKSAHAAHPLLTANKKFHHLITGDNPSMKTLVERRLIDLSLQIRSELVRVFHLSNDNIKNIFLSMERSSKVAKFQFEAQYLATVKPLHEIKVELQTPQSKDALRKLIKLVRQLKSIAKQKSFLSDEQRNMITKNWDLISGAMQVALTEPSPTKVWDTNLLDYFVAQLLIFFSAVMIQWVPKWKVFLSTTALLAMWALVRLVYRDN